jgi:endonuclease/exonuclease/phosphatase family metal-dependent hydrolase
MSRGDGLPLRVMTFTAGEGTDYTRMFRATEPPEYHEGVAKALLEAQATKPSERMRALAAQIAATEPALVSLQEVNRWSVAPFDLATGTCAEMKVQIDMLPALLAALRTLGAAYDIAAQTPQFDSAPMGGEFAQGDFRCVQVLNRNAILTRSYLTPRQLKWSNPQAGQFGVQIGQPAAATAEPVRPRTSWPISRSWLSVDVEFKGRAFRFIGAHLSNLGYPYFYQGEELRRQDAAELRAIADASPLPVVIAMDASAQAAPLPADATCADFIATGYRDAWSEAHPALPGFTCCQAATMDNQASQLSRRTDLVLLRGTVRVQNAAVLGAQPSSRTASGLWPSDHAGVAVQLSVGKTH